MALSAVIEGTERAHLFKKEQAEIVAGTRGNRKRLAAAFDRNRLREGSIKPRRQRGWL